MATGGVKSDRSSGTVLTPRGVNQGIVLVDPNTGLPIDVIEDGAGIRRLAVDANITAQDVSISVDLDGTDGDTVAIVDPDTGDSLQVEPDGSINVNCALDAKDGDNTAVSSHPNQIFDESSDIITTAGYEEIFSYTSASNLTRVISIESRVSTPSTFRVKINGSIKREKDSSPMDRSITFEFREHRKISSGDTITVEAKVDRFIHTTYDTFTSLEGYLA